MVAGDFFTHEGGTEGKIKYTDYKRKVNMKMKRISARISALILALVLGVCVFVSISCAASKTDSLPIQEGVTTLDELYTKCAEVQDEFSSLMQSLSLELGTKLVMRPGLKSRERTIAKAAESYHNDYSKVLDILAASLIFDSEEELYGAVDKLKAKSNFVYQRQPESP